MLTITITGERTSGKTYLGVVLKWILKLMTNYRVVLIEENTSTENARQISIWGRDITLHDIVRGEAKDLRIIVKNSGFTESREINF